jgi:hypothetical protein
MAVASPVMVVVAVIGVAVMHEAFGASVGVE